MGSHVRYRPNQNGDEQALLSACSGTRNLNTAAAAAAATNDGMPSAAGKSNHRWSFLLCPKRLVGDDKEKNESWFSLYHAKIKSFLCARFLVKEGRRYWSNPQQQKGWSSVLFLFLLLLLLLFFPWARFFVHSSESYQQHLAELQALRQQYPTIPANIKITAVVMNHNRPRMLRESLLMKTLLQHTAVDRIILTHSNPATKFVWEDPKITNIDAVAENEKMGLALRFAHCAAAAVTTTTIHDNNNKNNKNNKWVLIVDDDMEFTSDAVDDLIRAMMENDQRIVGHYGRGYHYWTALLRHGYHTRKLFGHVEVVLTKFMMVSPAVCAKFFEYEHLVHDFVAQSHPKWNGEDIFLNLVANHIYNVATKNGPYNNWAMADLQVWEASDELKDDDTGANDISGNMDRHSIWNVGVGNFIRALVKANAHARFRGELWEAAKERLSVLEEKERQ